MSLIAEDGTGLSTAESYISVADASTYFTNRGVTAWAAIATDALREAALRKATEYMTSIYRDRWQGVRTTPTVQALCWPRSEVVVERVYIENDVVPEIIKRACAELALKASAGDLLADLEQGVISETVGPISVTYDRFSPQRKRYPAIDAMLAPYLKAGGGCSVGLVRT
ncbi:MAG: hypothetical protein PHW03_05220 [Eubacteriales bacterium]|nr:hypothetical protein [Eubacteriales bacterium]